MKSSTRKLSEAEIKEFQEKKNLNDFMLQTNMSLNGLNDLMLSYLKMLEECRAVMGRTQQELFSDLENYKEVITRQALNSMKSAGDCKTSLEAISKEMSCKFEVLKEETVTESYLQVHLDEINQKIDQLLKGLERSNGKIVALDSSLRGLISSCIEELRIDLTPIKPEVDPLEVFVNEKIKAVQIDHKGLYKEIELLKRAQAYTTKQIETILIRIERLKEAK